jgi:hypothetical protein
LVNTNFLPTGRNTHEHPQLGDKKSSMFKGEFNIWVCTGPISTIIADNTGETPTNIRDIVT